MKSFTLKYSVMTSSFMGCVLPCAFMSCILCHWSHDFPIWRETLANQLSLQ